ncbi:beta strand repeat-containing protein [Cytophaga aurantiaca]|uniref:beta strand repeat-containing protein n=1 Tax=Cytophaga aurantiaca TaxID=29530 RepID=UPI000382C31B|nr:hypothetical protein [Cytophaga aurantiaca]
MFKNHSPSIGSFYSIILLFTIFLLPTLSHAASRTSSTTGNWNVTGTWGGASVPGATDVVTVNHGLNLNSNLTINAGGVYTFNASNTGGTPTVTMGVILGATGGELDIKSPATVTISSVPSMLGGTIHVYPGATLIITGDLTMYLGSNIIVDATGSLVIGGDFNNTDGDVVVNGSITVGGNYSSVGFISNPTVTGTGTFTSTGSMTNQNVFGSSTIFGSGSDCNTGPCSGACLTGMVTGAITGTTTFCSATSTTFTTPTVSGATTYTWTFPSGFTVTAGAGTRSITVSVAAAASSGNITVQASSSTCTGNTSTLAVTVAKPVGTATVTGSSAVCQGSSQVYSVSGVTGATSYTWSVPSDATITAGAGTNSITVTMGATSGPISVTPSNTCGNATGAAIGSKTVTVNLTNAATITYPSSSYFCTGTSAAQVPTITGTAGGTFTKTAGTLTSFSTSTGSFVPNGSTATSYTITYTMAATACPAATATASITVSSVIPSGTASIAGTAAVCQNTSYTYSVSGVTGAIGYTWSVPSDATITAGAGTSSITVTMGTTNGTVSVVPYNGCGNATGVTLGSKAITVSPTNAATIAYSASTYCRNTSTTQVPTITGTTGGIFSYSSTGTLTGFSTSTGAFTPNTSTSNRTYTITYTIAATSCPSATATTTFVVSNSTLNSPATPSGTTPVCQNTAGGIYSIAAVTNANNYTWTVPAGAVITAGSTTRSITVTMGNASGTFTVTPASATCTGNTSNPFTVTVNPCTNTWTGASNTSWIVTGNWSLGTVPTSGNTVVIPNVTNKPVITAGMTATVANLTINPSSSVTLTGTGSMDVYGSLTNSGTFTPSSATSSVVTFKGTNAATITGVPILYNATVNNAAGVTIASGAANAVTLKGKLALTNGTLTTNGNLAVDIDNGGNIGYASGDAGSVSGDVKVFRAINSSTTHYISCPLDGVTAADLADDAQVINPTTTKTRLFEFDNTAYAWTDVSTLSTTMAPSDAFSMWFPATTSVDFTGTYNHAATYSYSSPNVATKFMFVSNPYPSTLDWEAASGWTKSGINNAVYFWNPGSNSYSSYVFGAGSNSATKNIPAMNSFFVAYNGSGGTATVSMSGLVRTATAASMWRAASDETVRLILKSSNASDETVIRFNEDATNEFDGDLDAFKMMNPSAVPSIYTMFGSTKYSINSIADPTAKDTIAVYTKVPADGDYVLSITSSDPSMEYVLVDKKLGTETVVTTGDYSFTALKTDDLNRFDLQMRQTTTTGVNTGTGNSSIAILSSPNGFLVKSTLSGTGTIEILDVTGNVVKVLSNVSLSNGNNFFTPEVAGGFYLIKVNMDNTSYVDHVSIIR